MWNAKFFCGLERGEYGNSFKSDMPRKQAGIVEEFIYRHFDENAKIVMNSEEMATVYHFPLPTTETPSDCGKT